MNQNSEISAPVDLQKFAIDVAHRLSSLRNFLDASEELLKCSEILTDADVQRHGRKILAMIEVARTTLNRAGLKLHLFTSCTPKYQPLKSAYFKMLVLLVRRHRDEFHPDLRGRVDRLLLPLTTRLVIGRNSDPYAQLGMADLMRNIDTDSQPKKAPLVAEASGCESMPRRLPPWPSNNIAASMPPPDAFPPKPEKKGKTRSLLDLFMRRARPVHRQHPPRPEIEVKPVVTSSESTPNMSRPFVRTRRHFGIFCTGNKLPQQQFRR
ncbi:hypothetical protein HYDPIDRAFT_28709 [Hydnomerulius pinastri MD-312]|uniref:Uncharacterized protein n=1 Tax=Hydnomerulius pinastri MD-312 TaxID=994086 RepID=A0A0C9W9A4_9AGAM|nr:hypothetical protein HYDPIDRAFT_28709 [Hydnomerulius pinastri MD-312]